MNKDCIRNNIKSKRDKLSIKEVSELSDKIIEKAINMLDTFPINTYFVYNSFKNEVDTKKIIRYLLRNNKDVYLPKVLGEDMIAIKYEATTKLENGTFNILEPLGNPTSIDNFICIIPVIAIDKQGNRIGFGKGYYDKFLANKKCIKIGLCYDFQIINDLIDVRKEDIPIDIIITETQIIEFKKKRN